MGVIAQKMKEIAPYTIGTFTYQDPKGAKEEYLDYDANAVIYILINSVKQQQIQIEELKRLITRQSNQPQTSASTPAAAPTPAVAPTRVDLSNKNTIVLDQNVPNPFGEKTIINYSIPLNASRAQVLFHNTARQLIKTSEITNKGKGQITVFANYLSSGIYNYTLVVDGKTIDTKKMIKQQ